MTVPLKVFIIAGEPSGDKLGGNLMEGLNTLTKGQISFAGVGGEMMQASGLKSLFPMSDLTVMGLFEVIPSIPKIKRRIDQAAHAAIELCPDVLITIDSPDFCLRVGKKLRGIYPDQFSVHYVAPSVWAWRPERAEKMAKTVNHVLALLPFEPPFMERVGMSCDFVGHPAATEDTPTKAQIKTVLGDLGLKPSDEIIAVLPGSRRSEIKRLMPLYKDAIKRVLNARPKAQFVLPAARPILAEVQVQLAGNTLPIHVLDPTAFTPHEAEHRKRAVYAASSAALATSGTIALDLAKQRCPMVVAYKASWLTERAVKRLAKIDRANLINIVTDSYVVPEFLFDKCTADVAAKALLTILRDQEIRDAQIAALNDTMQQLGEGGDPPGMRAAKSVLDAIRKNQT
jgi:lipid-A-disaccharide synthase